MAFGSEICTLEFAGKLYPITNNLFYCPHCTSATKAVSTISGRPHRGSGHKANLYCNLILASLKLPEDMNTYCGLFLAIGFVWDDKVPLSEGM